MSSRALHIEERNNRNARDDGSATVDVGLRRGRRETAKRQRAGNEPVFQHVGFLFGVPVARSGLRIGLFDQKAGLPDTDEWSAEAINIRCM